MTELAVQSRQEVRQLWLSCMYVCQSLYLMLQCPDLRIWKLCAHHAQTLHADVTDYTAAGCSCWYHANVGFGFVWLDWLPTSLYQMCITSCKTACDWYQAIKYWRSFCETLHRELIVCILLALKFLFPREHALRLLHGIHVRWHVVLWYVNSDHYIFFADVTQIQWVINCTQVGSYD